MGQRSCWCLHSLLHSRWPAKKTINECSAQQKEGISHRSVSGTVDQDSKWVIRCPPLRLRASYASEGHSDPTRRDMILALI